MLGQCIRSSFKKPFISSFLKPTTPCLGVAAIRSCSEGGKLVAVDMNEETGVATVQLNRPPVNSLSLELLRDLNSSLERLQGAGSGSRCKGLVLTSAKPGVFSAGIDIQEMYKPEESRLREFWTALQETWILLYGSSLPVVAAINGHSPAGGCLLAITTDYRVMASGKFTIGLNETKLGIVAPFWFMDTLINTVGLRQAEMALQLGTMFTSEEALRIGMVDEVCPLEEVQARAQAELKKWMAIYTAARQLSKYAIRAPFVSKLVQKRAEDTDRFVEFTMKDSIQLALGEYLKALSQRKK